MKAVIIAAGEGQRMRPLTNNTPKPLLKINGKPIIDYVFDSFPSEITEVIVVVKYLGNQIKDFLGKSHKGRKIFVIEGSEKGNAFSFLATKPFIDRERFLFTYGDELPNPLDVVNCMKQELAVLVFKSDRPQSQGIAHLNHDGTIKEVIEKPKVPKSDLGVDGIMTLNDKIFYYPALPNPTGEYYFTSLLNQFVKQNRVWPVKTSGFIGDLTTPDDLKRITSLLRGKDNPHQQ